MREALQVLPIEGIGRITPGTDLAEAIATAAPWLRDGDVLVVTSKIVSKSEGQLVDLPSSVTTDEEREAARLQVLASETARVVASRGPTRIVATHHGFVMASAGIDNSNVDPSQLVLLPKDPDASARSLRSALAERFGLDVAVIISDTMGRPWRNGLTDVALGAAGITPILDHRGEVDPYGNELQLTQMAVVDELAAAAELVKGKCDQVPVAVVRGWFDRPLSTDGPGAVVMIRDSESDLFSLGTAEARALGLREAAALGVTGSTRFPVPGLAEPFPFAPTTRVSVEPDGIRLTSSDLITLGVDAHRLLTALTAAGHRCTLTTTPDAALIEPSSGSRA